MTRFAILIGTAVLGLSACSNPDKAALFDGQRYTGRLQVDKENKRNFTATSAPVSQGLEGAREAARYEGTTYCVRKYGSSDIVWAASPEAEATALSIVDDTLTVQGRCAE